MFTGQRPFVGNALGDLVLQICVRDMPVPSRLAPVPAGFDDWFAKAADRDPDRRFQSARDLAAALRDVVGGGERDVELVVADDVDPFREAPTPQSTSPEAVEALNPSAGPIELAKTLLDEPSPLASVVEPQPAAKLLESPDTTIPESPAREHGLGRIVLVATAAIILVMISINTYYGRRKISAAPSANVVATAAFTRAIATAATEVPPVDELPSPQVAQQGDPAAQQHEPVASPAVERSVVPRNVARASPSRRETPSSKPIASAWDWREVVSAMGGSSVGSLLKPATSAEQQPSAIPATTAEVANTRPAERNPEPAASTPSQAPPPPSE
jgi:serine/threonine-protein kinase